MARKLNFSLQLGSYPLQEIYHMLSRKKNTVLLLGNTTFPFKEIFVYWNGIAVVLSVYSNSDNK